jgi:hypothetical protein
MRTTLMRLTFRAPALAVCIQIDPSISDARHLMVADERITALLWEHAAVKSWFLQVRQRLNLFS